MVVRKRMLGNGAASGVEEEEKNAVVSHGNRGVFAIDKLRPSQAECGKATRSRLIFEG